MNYSYLFISHIIFVLVIVSISEVIRIDIQQDERISLECIITSKTDVEEAMWMRIRSPHNPDILTYRDSVVYLPNHIKLEQRRLSSSRHTNGTFIDTYFLTLIILRVNIDDEARYVCSKDRIVFAEYDLFIIVPPQFVDQRNFIQQQSIIEGSTLHLSCAAEGRPIPSITWFYRTNSGKLILLGDGSGCQEPVCELYLANYTRHDPTIIECIADNKKSSRISKVFHIDVLYPPKIIINIQTVKELKRIDFFLECSSSGNPLPSISWFDDNQHEINNYNLYTIKTKNPQASILSFSVYSNEHPKILYYCRSNNSVGTVEKLINISDFIKFDVQKTTIRPSTIAIGKKPKHGTEKSNHIQFKPSSTTGITISSKSSISSYSSILFLIFIICNFIK